jgi:hypothetical protein
MSLSLLLLKQNWVIKRVKTRLSALKGLEKIRLRRTKEVGLRKLEKFKIRLKGLKEIGLRALDWVSAQEYSKKF